MAGLVLTVVLVASMYPYRLCTAADIRDHVALLGTNVSFTCVANITATPSTGIELVGIVINNKHHLTPSDAHSIIDEIYVNRSFTWTFFERDSQKIGKLDVLASKENNETTVRCIINGKIMKEEKIIVVEGPPGPPGAPTLTVTNLTTLTLMWTAPWPHPISNYTVTMLNLTSGQQSQWTTCDEYLVMQRGEERGQCNELVFTVLAAATVGSSETSPNTTGGFPKGFDVLSKKQTRVNVTCWKSTSILQVTANVPELCSYEADVTVTLNVTDVVDEQNILLGPTNQLMFEVSKNTSNLSVSCDSTYNVSLTVKNQVNERIYVHTVYGYSTSSPTRTFSPTKTSAPTRTSTPIRTSTPTSTSTPSSEPNSGSTMLYIIIAAAGGGGVILICVLLIACCGCVIACRCSRRPAVTINVETNGTTTTNGVTPHSMVPSNMFANNPIYQTSSEDATYETIPYPLELRSLPPALPARNSSNTPSASPKFSIDEHGNGSTETPQPVQFILQQAPPPLMHHSCTLPSETDEYISMGTPNLRSMSPRYAEAPFFKFPSNLEALSEAREEHKVAVQAMTVNSPSVPSPLPYL